MSEPSVIGFVPARSGSKRLANKNIRELAGHPLVGYAIQSALQSEVFPAVLVSTDSPEIAEIAVRYGAERCPFSGLPEMATATSADIEWVELTLTRLREEGREYDCFSILRPTSPFRQPETIRRAWDQFRGLEGIDSIRAVEKCRQHPMKMWVVEGDRMKPLIPGGPVSPPWHSTQYQALPPVHAQNASLEIAWTRVVFEGQGIAGRVVAPFFTEGAEGFDINDRYDWMVAEELVRNGEGRLPQVKLA